MTDFGIDLSHHNHVQDWNAVRSNNITFSSMKLTESTGFTDDHASAHVAAARAAGISCGGYHFARPGSVAAQVTHFTDRLDALSLLAGDSLLPMLDMEAATLRSSANEFVQDFIDRFRATTGVRGMLVYANLDWFTNALRPDDWVDEDIFLWIARYNGNPGKPGYAHRRLALHQHTDKGKVPGILPALVDRNVTMEGFARSDLLIDRAGSPVPAGGAAVHDLIIPAPREPVVAAPRTHTVVRGDTLTRIAERHHTTVAVLVAINGIPDPNLIAVGQVLTLPDAMIPA